MISKIYNHLQLSEGKCGPHSAPDSHRVISTIVVFFPFSVGCRFRVFRRMFQRVLEVAFLAKTVRAFYLYMYRVRRAVTIATLTFILRQCKYLIDDWMKVIKRTCINLQNVFEVTRSSAQFLLSARTFLPCPPLIFRVFKVSALYRARACTVSMLYPR